jgi:hypothetical protein
MNYKLLQPNENSMDSVLSIWVDALTQHIGLIDEGHQFRKATRRAILIELEKVGYARRRLNCDGRIVWRATKAMRRYLRDCEIETEDDL